MKNSTYGKLLALHGDDLSSIPSTMHVIDPLSSSWCDPEYSQE